MTEWFNILNEVREVKGKQKLEVLKTNNDNDTLKEVLNFLYNPRVTTGISKKKMSKDHKEIYDINFSDSDDRVNSLMSYLAEHNTGKDENVITAKSIVLTTDNMLEKEMLESLIVKDVPFGISASTVNKAFPNLIPVFKLQKGQLFEGTFEGTQAVSLKLDGNSATVFNLKEETYMLSRSGAIMVGFDHILNFYRENMPMGFVYQGELIAKNYDNLNHSELFKLSNGITNSKKHEEKEVLQHVIFDIIAIDHFEEGKSDVPYFLRMKFIEDYDILQTYEPYGETYDDVCLVPFYAWTDDENKIGDIAKEIMDQGLEGLMICKADSIYKTGKQGWLQKIKEFQTMDLEVTDLKEHVRGNKVGSLIVNYHGGEVKVGGIKDEDRIKWWNEPNSIIGKIVEVKFFRETTDKHGKQSLRFPTFVRIRDDKFEESYE